MDTKELVERCKRGERQATDKIARQIMSAVRSKARVRTVSKRWRIIGFIMRNLPWCLYKRM